MGKGDKRPSWFKMFLHQKPIVDSVPDAVVGQAIKAAFNYFDSREEPQLDALPMVVFSAFKPYIDESFSDYDRDVRNGNKGGRPKKPPVTPGKGGHPSQTQAEADADADAEAEARNNADKPPAPAKQARKSYGEFGWVKLTDDEYNRLINDLGEAEVKRCIAYVDESAQATGNKNRWRDWNLVVRKCHKQGWGMNQQQKIGGYESGVDRLARMYREEFGE